MNFPFPAHEVSESIAVDTGDKYLFLFAHPDDDVFISGTMRLLIETGSDLLCVWLTSGDFFGKGFVREQELRSATRILGLAPASIKLMRLPDLGLMRVLDESADHLAETITAFNPDRIFTTAFEGGHPDHDATNFLAYEACYRIGRDPNIYEFPLYNGSGPIHKWKWRINKFPPDGLEVFHTPLTATAVSCRFRMMRAYQSQWMYMIPARLASSRWHLMQTGEPYRRCPFDRNHCIPPHRGKLNYERWFNFFIDVTFEEFKGAVLAASVRPRP